MVKSEVSVLHTVCSSLDSPITLAADPEESGHRRQHRGDAKGGSGA